jgi:hypothetical protein
MEDKLKLFGIIVVLAITLWLSATSTTYRFAHPEKTQTQAFLHIIKSALLDFSEPAPKALADLEATK